MRELRKEKGLSQTKLAELADMHYTQIGRYEKGQTHPSLEALQKLADALEVSVGYLMEGDSEDMAKAHIHDKELLKQFQEVQDFSEDDKKVIKTLIEAFITKRKLKGMV